MAKRNQAAAAKELREYGLSLPESTEHFPWGERVLKVKGKVFVFLGRDESEGFGLSVKLPETGGAALTLPFTSPTGYGLGKSGWITAEFAAGKAVPVAMLREWIEESYRAVAPKKVLALLDGAAAPAAKKKPARAAKAKPRPKPKTAEKRRSGER
jgi:predicted DNA-binding protein (MmcQ/YjbR family)